MNRLLRLLLVPLLLAGGALRAQMPDDTDTDTPPIGSTLITSDELHSDQVTHQSIFTGNVKVVGQNFHMTCQEMTVFFTNDNKVERIIATGEVIITQPDRVTHCGHALYVQATDTFDLTQQPQILDHQNQYNSPEIIINRQTQQITMKGGRTRVVLPNKNMGSATTTPTVSSAGPLPGESK